MSDAAPEAHFRTPLRDVFPGAVPCPLGGAVVSIRQLTVGDVADLDRFVAAAGPLVDVDHRSGEAPAERRRRLVEAWRAVAEAPEWDHGDGSRLLETLLGRAAQLRLGAARAGSPLELETAIERVDLAEPGEWSACYRVLWGLPAWRRVAAELAPEWWERESPPEAKPADWGMLAFKLHEVYKLPWAEIEAMPIARWRLLMRRGEPYRFDGLPRRRNNDGTPEAMLQWLQRTRDAFTAPGPGAGPSGRSTP